MGIPVITQPLTIPKTTQFTYLNQLVEIAVYRSQANLRQHFLDLRIDPVRRGVGLVDLTTLRISSRCLL